MALNIYALAVISYGSDHLFLRVTVLNIVINIRKVCWRNVYSVLPSFRPVPVSGQKKVNSVIFDGILTLRPPKRSVGKKRTSPLSTDGLGGLFG